MSAENDTTMAAITHILGLVTWIFGPILMLVISDDPFVEENAKNALNWQIFVGIYFFVSGLLTVVFIGFLLLPVVALIDLVFCVLAAMKANDNESWTYPLTIDLV